MHGYANGRGSLHVGAGGLTFPMGELRAAVNVVVPVNSYGIGCSMIYRTVIPRKPGSRMQRANCLGAGVAEGRCDCGWCTCIVQLHWATALCSCRAARQWWGEVAMCCSHDSWNEFYRKSTRGANLAMQVVAVSGFVVGSSVWCCLTRKLGAFFQSSSGQNALMFESEW